MVEQENMYGTPKGQRIVVYFYAVVSFDVVVSFDADGAVHLLIGGVHGARNICQKS